MKGKTSRLIRLVFAAWATVFFLFMDALGYGNPCKIVCNKGQWDIRGDCGIDPLSVLARTWAQVGISIGADCTKAPDWLIPKVKISGRSHKPSNAPASNRFVPAPANRPRAATETTFTFTHTLEGDWPDVVGYICFAGKGSTPEEVSYICLIGLATESLGNNEYQSELWDKKIFWIDVGDSSPMHVCAIYAPDFEENGVAYDNVYWAPNFFYRAPGSDVSQDCDMWLYLNEDDEVEEIWIDIYDESGEQITKTKQLAIGDQLFSFTPALYLDEPGVFGIAAAEDRWQTVKAPPVFLYTHMTPNVDFAQSATLGVIDFTNVDLYYILRGEKENEEGVAECGFSTPKNLNLKWGDVQPSKTGNWNWMK